MLEQLAERDKDEDLAQYLALQRITMAAPWLDSVKELTQLADDLQTVERSPPLLFEAQQRRCDSASVLRQTARKFVRLWGVAD